MAINKAAEDQFFEKHRLEARNYDIDWADELASGEALSGNPTVYVRKLADGVFTDASSEFGISNETTSGTKSVWTLGVASSGNQDADDVYYVVVVQVTDNSQTLLSIHRLHVSEFADPTAP